MKKMLMSVVLSVALFFVVCTPSCVHGAQAKESSFKEAEKLITAAIDMTAITKGELWRAYGIMGATQMPQTSDELINASLGYLSLFHSAVLNLGETKLEKSYRLSKGEYLLLFAGGSSSWVYQREYFIRTIATYLLERFTFDVDGHYACVLTPLSMHPKTDLLSKEFENAYAFYAAAKKKGFTDKTLGDILGVVKAVLACDGVTAAIPKEELPFPAAIYTEVVQDARAKMARGMPFFEAMNGSMKAQFLHCEDVIAIPVNENHHAALKQIIVEDLAMLAEVKPEPKEEIFEETPEAERFDTHAYGEAETTVDEDAWYVVSRVIDGDTLVLENNDHVKLIGVETPESHMSHKLRKDAERVGRPVALVQKIGAEASAVTQRLCEGKKVHLMYDNKQYTDAYGRYLVYVYLEDGRMLNAELLKAGLGYTFVQVPFKQMYLFEQYEKEAYANKVGLWQDADGESVASKK